MKRRNLFVIAAWFLGAMLLLLLFFQMQSYAGIINDSGVVRGGTQRVAKMELAGERADETIERVESLLEKIEANEEGRFIKSPATLDFLNKVHATRNQWHLMLDEIAALRESTGSPERLLELSERHFELADDMVFAAQVRAEQEFAASFFIGLVLILAVTTLVLFLERNGMRQEKRAYHTDLLTHGKNLTAFEEEARAVLDNAKDERYLIAYSNIFNFRLVNESYGHETGNRFIVSTGKILEDHCEPGEICAHANADHFVLLLKNRKNRMRDLIDELRKHLDEQIGSAFPNVLRHGFGVCEATKGASVAEAISNATAALKEGTLVKGVAWYDNAFKIEVNRRNTIVKHMAQSLSDGEFKVYFQPQIDLETNRIVGAEALCRWNSEALGFLSPDSFIPLFEKNGRIVDLDYYMLERACEAYASYEKAGCAPNTFAVNFSRSTIIQRDFSDRIARTVARFGIDRGRLEIEVTETIFSVDENAVVRIVDSLVNAGFRIAMDDFGTGYSSLSLLYKLPIDVLKLDRSFISQEQATEREIRILQGVIDLANDLGMATVCEGVETAEQAKALKGLGCAIGQGYLYARPMPAEKFEEFLRSWNSGV
ncbi:putative bifunctional diguanylate cyclase/phosphodiesterase [Raoultibacter phocaeensis]|uniref:putative bifunctional diguanylate cyclase/phosphodiesterase n=1 Tax=Raoultibacter phocaeensis TaxID=2479841 RepID=UPI0011197BFC|nr:GGDEF domain-containing phosphodiesterase [Raoultibacter phocaeensis]